MKYIYKDLGILREGTIVIVTLRKSAANVCLLNSTNYQHYKNGRSFKYIGGLYDSSPIKFRIPTTNHWYVTVDMNGLRGTVEASISVQS